jgi:uncharacterized protein with PQ loop repeat
LYLAADNRPAFAVQGFGIGAAAITSFSCLLRFRRALPRRSAADLSLKTLIALAAGLMAWIAYGLIIQISSSHWRT